MNSIKTKLTIGAIVSALSLIALTTCIFAQSMNEPAEEPTLTAEYPMDLLFDRFFDERFFRSFGDPFQEMKRMRQDMKRALKQEPAGGVFDSWFKRKFGGGNLADIQQREDDRYIYYDVAIRDVKDSSLEVKVEDGQIYISGRTEKRSKNSFSSSQFHRSLPVPKYVEENKMEFEQDDGKLVVKFPKKSKS